MFKSKCVYDNDRYQLELDRRVTVVRCEFYSARVDTINRRLQKRSFDYVMTDNVRALPLYMGLSSEYVEVSRDTLVEQYLGNQWGWWYIVADNVTRS